jgi:two-component system response regulator NreC
MNMVRVFVADDHAMVRSGLRLLMEREADLTVVGEAPDGRAALEWIEREQADVAVIDVAMPGLNGIEAASQITRKHSDVGIVMLSMHSDETYVLRCLRAGARAYVLKESAENELIAAIRAVTKGKSFFSPKVRRLLQQEHVERIRRAGGQDSYDLLTEREREVLQLIAEGNSNKEIATRLFLSVYTVETHRKNILDKLHLRGTSDLILYAVRKAIIQ